ncbi:methylmalonyl-CoA epimerase [Salinibacter altiplanensis]|uniref:methylmalonyl-CoA epimerase n=1 Tax=Salinibacter altiplanensis TaxID=1803181 RepID=UPI001E5E3038|nr:methylmalonyl-CoA epimerase [Salinibacter altiplanensis]
MAHLDHIGIAVDDAAAVVERFRDLLGTAAYKTEAVRGQQVRTHFLDAGSAKLELLEALGDDSPVQHFLDRQGEGLHHVAFEVDDLSATMARLRNAEFELLSEDPQDGADAKRIAFVHPAQTHGVLVEFCESTRPDWTPRTVPRHDGHLEVFERGARDHPSLLVLHGAAGTTRHDAASLMRHLESSFHVVGVNLSGHGASAVPNDISFSLDLFAEDARSILDAIDLPSAHVFGFSLGGGAALRLAQMHPGRIDRLAVLQTNAHWTDAHARRMQRRLDLDDLADPASARAERLRARHDAPKRLLRALQSFVTTLPDASDTLTQTLPDLDTPTLVAGLDRDPLFELASTRALHDALPNARLAILPGDTHSLSRAPTGLLASLLTSHFSEA